MMGNLCGRLMTGSVIVLIGLVLLLSTTGFVEMRSVWGWIVALFVLVGAWALIRSEFRDLVGSVMIIAIAGTFFLRNVGVLSDDAIGTWWPLFVVLFGFLLMISRSRRRQRVRLEGIDAIDEVSVVSVSGATNDESPRIGSRERNSSLSSVIANSTSMMRTVERAPRSWRSCPCLVMQNYASRPSGRFASRRSL
jgi:hypothetical protein